MNQEKIEKANSTKTSDFKINADEISEDVEKLIAKYYKGSLINIVSEVDVTNERGFFLLFIDRNKNDVNVRTFGSNVTIEDIMEALKQVIRRTFNEENNHKDGKNM